MNRQQAFLVFSTGIVLAGCSAAVTNTTTGTTNGTSNTIANLQPYTTPTGTIATYTTAGSIDTTGVFFQKLGGNQRSCSNCHQLSQGLSISAAANQTLFTASNGTDPLFTAIDGANCPSAATADASAHSLILNNGLIRIPIEPPTTAQFTVTAAQDPYGCAVSTDATTGRPVYSVYRRPLPVGGLTFLSSVMWDARETLAPLTSAASFASNLVTDLSAQAAQAVTTHEQAATPPTEAQQSALVAFEDGLFVAQATDNQAGSLSANGATGGAAALAALTYTPGENDPLAPGQFNPQVFTLYTAWAGSANTQQASIARGENIFNTAPLNITAVRGINDNAALGNPVAVKASCSFCHNTPNVGSHSTPLTLDTGTAHAASAETNPQILAALQRLAPPSLPVYQITGCSNANGTAVTYTTTDPATGLFSGNCADVNRLKVPSLRGLAGRAPYFHNGSAASLTDLVNFYNARFQMGLNQGQITDLVNFLNAL